MQGSVRVIEQPDQENVSGRVLIDVSMCFIKSPGYGPTYECTSESNQICSQVLAKGRLTGWDRVTCAGACDASTLQDYGLALMPLMLFGKVTIKCAPAIS